MPLDRAHISNASATMLPAYVVLCTVFGLGYVIDPQGRLGVAPSTTFQREVAPLDAWGGILLGLAALMVAALFTRRRLLFAYALCCGVLTWAVWGCVIAASIPITPNTSYLAPVPAWFFAVCCLASTRSLVSREV